MPKTAPPATPCAFLIGVELKSHDNFEIRESIAEQAELAVTASAQITGEGIQKLDTPAPATFIGKGKAEGFAELNSPHNGE